MIRTIHFPGLTALPLFVASKKGFFAARDVDVSLIPAANSRQLMVGLLGGEYDIGQAGIDNLIAYQEKQAAPELDVERDLIGFMATSSTNLDLVVQPDIHSFSALKGKTLGVDALTTGFAFVLKKMLERGGLDESDYTLAAVGGDTARLAALKKGEIAGGLLASDFAAEAAAAGMHTLTRSLDVLHDYQGTCLFTRFSWARSHRDELISFTRAVRDAHNWIFDPENTTEAAALLAAQGAGMPAAAAVAAVRHFTTDRGGLSQTGALNLDGLKVVLALRSQYGSPKRELHDPKPYFDSSYVALAEALPSIAGSRSLETQE